MSAKLRLLVSFLTSAVGVVLLAILLSTLFPIHGLLAGALLLPVGLGGMVVTNAMLGRSQPRLGGAQRKALMADTRYAAMFREASEHMVELEGYRRTEREPEVKRQISHLHGTADKIMGHLAQYPEQIPQARRFFTYYLQTALTVLKQREDFMASGLRTQEVTDGIRVAEKTLPRLNQAFEGQLTNLMSGRLMDLEAESKLLETAIRMDGLPVEHAPRTAEDSDASHTPTE